MSAISIQQIEIFLAVASSDSISAAARALFISQPAVSDIIRGMEKTLGYSLFSRNNRGVVLTERGVRLYAELDPVYKRFRLASDKILSGGAANADALNIGAFHNLPATRAMLSAAGDFERRFPRYAVKTEYYNHSELLEKLLCEELDVSFTFSFGAESNPELECLRLCALEQFFLVPDAFGLTEAEPDFSRLDGKTLILEVSANRESVLNICRAYGFAPGRVKFVNSVLTLAYLIADGEGFTVGGRYLPGKDDASPRVTAVPVSAEVSGERVHLVAARRRGDDREIMRDFVKTLESAAPFADADDINGYAPENRWYR
ncbi:MAG: LysR family transcriptional regulator [Oscillospiraceae bacterium]|jgi:DNA-binding transcriptional LysR family regulator|nr:LysR family transcriptional regulator [Oscillospiraceae bacterium]